MSNAPDLNSTAYTEEMFHQIALGWWAEKYAYNDVIGTSNSVVHYQLPSHTLAGSPLKASYFYGIARSAGYASRIMDAKEDLLMAAHAGGDDAQRRNFLLAAGQVGSYLEAGIYDQAFLMEPGHSMSTVTALKAANERGIPIYTIDSGNAAALNQIQTDSADLQDMADAVAAGLRVTTAKQDISVDNFTGLGYIVEDPQTGAAAYIISGGRHGGDSPAQSSATPNNADPAPGVLLIGAITDALATDAKVGSLFLRFLAGMSMPAGAIVLGIVVLAIIAGIVLAAVVRVEEFRQQVIDLARGNALFKDFPEDNCRLTNVQLKPAAVPLGWAKCTYTCTSFFGGTHPRYLPLELACPTPVPCAPGLPDVPPDTRTPFVDAIDPAVATCVFR